MSRYVNAILMVRRVGKKVRYYIQQGNSKVDFILPLELHEELKRAQALCDAIPERRRVQRGAIELREAGSDQIASADGSL